VSDPADLPPLAGNPLLDELDVGVRDPGHREHLRRRFGFTAPDEDALALVAANSARGVVEIGAGVGYWARLLHEHGVDVLAYDIAPPPAPANRWFDGQQPWFPIHVGDAAVAAEHLDRTLLIVWPTRNETWAADAAARHLAGGGTRLVYVGEPPGGRTGDVRLHAVLGLSGDCLACRYAVTSVPCTCDITTTWERVAELPVRGLDGDSHLYVFRPPARPPAGLRRLVWLRR